MLGSNDQIDGELVSRASAIKSDPKRLAELSVVIQAFGNECLKTVNAIEAIAEVFIHFNESIEFLKPVSTSDASPKKAAIWMQSLYSTFEDLVLLLIHAAKKKTAVSKAVCTLLRLADLKQDDELRKLTTAMLVTRGDVHTDVSMLCVERWFQRMVEPKSESSALRALVHCCKKPAIDCAKLVFDFANSRLALTKECTLESSAKRTAALCRKNPALKSAFLLSWLKSTDGSGDDDKTDEDKSESMIDALVSFYSLNLTEILLKLSPSLAASSDCRELVTKRRKKKNVYGFGSDKWLLSECWMGLLSERSLPVAVYYRVLKEMDSGILPHLSSPLLLGDFLQHSYDIGGEVSLLALRPMFTLINEHNYDYPLFYDKLYALLKTSLFLSKHCQAFFKELSMFILQSADTLPQQLLAAFCKRLSRMSLFASPKGVVLILSLVCSMLKRYSRSLAFLIDRSAEGHQGVIEAIALSKAEKRIVDDEKAADGCAPKKWKSGMANDPFDAECDDPKRCKAMQSSLWELKALARHYEYRTAGHAFDTVLHCKSTKYQPMAVEKCHLFGYQKLLNYYFRRFEKQLIDFRNQKKGVASKRKRKRRQMETERRKGDSDTDDEDMDASNLFRISFRKSDHLFAETSVFRDVWTL